ncbi:hypothetical protein Gotri_001064, partial [Gossypium trilobum]|nr:hypothetical protein [Gossypium trilobum]
SNFISICYKLKKKIHQHTSVTGIDLSTPPRNPFVKRKRLCQKKNNKEQQKERSQSV